MAPVSIFDEVDEQDQEAGGVARRKPRSIFEELDDQEGRGAPGGGAGVGGAGGGAAPTTSQPQSSPMVADEPPASPESPLEEAMRRARESVPSINLKLPKAARYENVETGKEEWLGAAPKVDPVPPQAPEPMGTDESRDVAPSGPARPAYREILPDDTRGPVVTVRDAAEEAAEARARYERTKAENEATLPGTSGTPHAMYERQQRIEREKEEAAKAKRRGVVGPLPRETAPGLFERVSNYVDERGREEEAEKARRLREAGEQADHLADRVAKSESRGETAAAVARSVFGTVMGAAGHPFEVLPESVNEVLAYPFKLTKAMGEEAVETWPETFDPKTTEGRRNLDLIGMSADMAGLILAHRAGQAIKAGAKAVGPSGPKTLGGVPGYVPPPWSVGQGGSVPEAFRRTPPPVPVARPEPFARRAESEADPFPKPPPGPGSSPILDYVQPDLPPLPSEIARGAPAPARLQMGQPVVGPEGGAPPILPRASVPGTVTPPVESPAPSKSLSGQALTVHRARVRRGDFIGDQPYQTDPLTRRGPLPTEEQSVEAIRAALTDTLEPGKGPHAFTIESQAIEGPADPRPPSRHVRVKRPPLNIAPGVMEKAAPEPGASVPGTVAPPARPPSRKQIRDAFEAEHPEALLARAEAERLAAAGVLSKERLPKPPASADLPGTVAPEPKAAPVAPKPEPFVPPEPPGPRPPTLETKPKSVETKPASAPLPGTAPSRHPPEVRDFRAKEAEMLKARRARDAERRAFVETHGEVPVEFPATLRGSNAPRKIIISKSLREPGKWQGTWFDERGPGGDTARASYAEIIQEMQRDFNLDFGKATVGKAKPAAPAAAPKAAPPPAPGTGPVEPRAEVPLPVAAPPATKPKPTYADLAKAHSEATHDLAFAAEELHLAKGNARRYARALKDYETAKAAKLEAQRAYDEGYRAARGEALTPAEAMARNLELQEEYRTAYGNRKAAIREEMDRTAEIVRKDRERARAEKAEKEAAKPAPPASVPGTVAETAPAPIPAGPLKPIFDEHGRKYRYSVESVPMDKIVTSHDNAGAKDARYPEDFQSRDFDIRRADDMSKNLDLDKLTPEGSSPTTGSAVVWLEPETGLYHVVAGNHRTVAARMSGRFGNRMPVRVLDASRAEARQLAAASQRVDAAPESTIERARAAVRGLDVTIEDVPRNVGAEPITRDNVGTFVRANPGFASKVLRGAQADPAAAAARLNETLVGLLPESVQRVLSAVGTKAEAAITGSAPAILDLHKRAMAGEVRPEFDLLPMFDRAAEAIESFAGKGLSKGEIVRRLNHAAEQPSLPGMKDPVHAMGQADAATLLGLVSMEGRADPAGAMASAMFRVRQRALGADSPRQGGLFGEAVTVDPMSVLRDLWGEKVVEQAGKFNPTGSPAQAHKSPGRHRGEAGVNIPLAMLADEIIAGTKAIGRLTKAGASYILDGVETVTRENPRLRKFDRSPGFNEANAMQRLRVAEGAMGETGWDMARSIYNGISREDFYAGAAEYPVLRNQRRRLMKGQTQSADLAQVQQRISDIEARIPRAKLDRLMQRLRDEYSEPLYQEQVRIGALKTPLPSDPAARSAILDDYIHNVVMKFAAKDRPSSGPGQPPGSKFVGSSVKALGSKLPIESNAFLIIQQHAAEVLSAGLRFDYIEGLKAKHGLTELARQSGLDQVGDAVLYNFDGPNKGMVRDGGMALAKEALAQELVSKKGGRYRRIEIQDPQTNQIQYRTEAIQPGEPLKLMERTGTGQQVARELGHLIPKELAEALMEADKSFKLPGLVKVAAWIADKTRKLTLGNNLSYHFRQAFIDDPSSIMASAPAGFEVHAAAKFAGYVLELKKELRKTHRGERSPMIEDLRKRGMWGGHLFDYANEAVDASGHILKAENLPWEYKPLSERLKYVGKSAVFPSDSINQVREAAAKLALYDLGVKKLGMSDARATTFAHERTGGYWERSALERYLSPFTQFVKWHATALGRVTIRALEDPVTGKFFGDAAGAGRALRTSPAVKAALIGGIVMAWNYWQDKDAYKEMVDAGMRTNQPLLIEKDPKTGKWLTIGAEGAGGHMAIFDGVVDAVVRARRTGLLDSLTVAGADIGKAGLARTSAAVYPIEAIAGIDASTMGPLISDKERAMSTPAQRASNRKDTGLPLTFGERELVERVVPTYARIAKLVAGDPGANAAQRATGVPVGKLDVRLLRERNSYRNDERFYRQWVDELAKPREERDSKLLDQLRGWAAANHRGEAWRSRRTKGRNEARKRGGRSLEERQDIRLRKFSRPGPAIPGTE